MASPSDLAMATKETRRLRGRRRGTALAGRALSELESKREFLGISQRAMASELGCSQAHLWRVETNQIVVSVVRLAEMASVLGLELSVGLHEIGDPIRDKGHQALGKRFDAVPSAQWQNMAEVLLPNVGDRRSWDRVLRLLDPPPGRSWALISRRGSATSRRSSVGRESANATAASTRSSSSSVTAPRTGISSTSCGWPSVLAIPRHRAASSGDLRAGHTVRGSGVVLI